MGAAALRSEQAVSYADTLLRMLSAAAPLPRMPGGVGILEDGRQMKRRIRRIASFRPPRLIGSAAGMALILAAAVVVLGRQAESTPPAADAPAASRPRTPEELRDRFLAAARAHDSAAVRAVLRSLNEYTPHLTADGIDSLLGQLAAENDPDAFAALLGEFREIPLGVTWQPSPESLKTLVANGQTAFLDVLLASRLDTKLLAKQAAAGNAQTQSWIASRVAEVDKQRADQNALVTASGKGDLETMRRFLDAGADVNGAGSNGFTPLTKAAVENQPAAVRLLLDRGADVDLPKSPGWDYTALCLAKSPEVADLLFAAGANVNAKLFGRDVPIVSYCVRWGPPEMVRWFLDHGVDPNAPTGEKYEPTLLFSAGDPETAALLLDRGVPLDARNEVGETALFWIEQMVENPAEIVRVLLQRGADPNARDKNGNTLLMAAPDAATVEVLAAAGADLTARSDDGQNVLKFTGGRAKADRDEALRRHGVRTTDPADGGKLLVRAVLDGDDAKTASLLKDGANPDFPVPELEKPGGSAMALALSFGRFKQVDLMREAGGRDVGLFSQAAAMGDVKKMAALLAAGASIDERTIMGQTPLHFAVRRAQVEAAKFLLARGASPLVCDQYGWTPLNLAQTSLLSVKSRRNAQSTEMSVEKETSAFETLVSLLKKSAPEREPVNTAGETPIFFAAARGNVIALGMAIQDKADLNAQRADGMTPMMVAVVSKPPGTPTDRVRTMDSKTGEPRGYSEHGFVVKRLLDAGADASLRDHEGKTALDLARERGDDEIVGIIENAAK